MVKCPFLMQLIKQLKTARHSFYIVVVANHIFVAICLFICMVWMLRYGLEGGSHHTPF